MAPTPHLAPATFLGAALLARLDALAEIEAGRARSPVQEGDAGRMRCGRRAGGLGLPAMELRQMQSRPSSSTWTVSSSLSFLLCFLPLFLVHRTLFTERSSLVFFSQYHDEFSDADTEGFNTAVQEKILVRYGKVS
jgi:hypothetical protein